MSKNSEDLIVWSDGGETVRLAARCANCGGCGRLFVSSDAYDECAACNGLGWFGIDPRQPVMAHAGSVEKVAMLTARYASGAPLWNRADGANSNRRPPKRDDDRLTWPITASESAALSRASGSDRRPTHLAP